MSITKKAVCLAALLGIANVTIAQEPPDDETLKRAIGIILVEASWDDLPTDPEYRFTTIQDIADKHKASPEQMTRVLEELVREELSTLEKAQGVEKQVCEGFISTLVQQFSHFHGPDTPALVKECALIFGDRSTVEDYITLSGGGGDSVFLLRDFIARGDTKDFDRYPLYERLGNFIPQLTGKGQTADVDKILAFMKEMIQTEQGLGSARELDKILCAHLEGYADDPQRQPVLKRIEVMAEETKERLKMMDKELEEINEYLRRQREEREAQRAAPKPAQPPAAVEQTQPVTAPDTQPEPDNPSEPKSTPWKLPLLIGIIVIGAIAAWCRLKGKRNPTHGTAP